MFEEVPSLSKPSKKGSAKDTALAKHAAIATRTIGTTETSAVFRSKKATPWKSNTSANSAQKKGPAKKKAKPGKK